MSAFLVASMAVAGYADSLLLFDHNTISLFPWKLPPPLPLSSYSPSSSSFPFIFRNILFLNFVPVYLYVCGFVYIGAGPIEPRRGHWIPCLSYRQL